MTSSIPTSDLQLSEPTHTETETIVGAGICGLFTSLALSRQGFNVTLFERNTRQPEGNAVLLTT